MTITFSAPSKTFLSGEYAVLNGNPALLVNTGPRFHLQARRGSGSVTGIPTSSPAWEWMELRSPLLREWNIEFFDPHSGRGGFGASGAQFLFVHTLTTLLQSSVSRAVQGIDVVALLSDYRVLTGGRASGADILSQSKGYVTRVVGERVDSAAWPFADLSFAILRTGNKISTHEHLEVVDRGALSELGLPSHAVVRAFAARARQEFLAAVNTFTQTLRRLHLQTQLTLDILRELEGQDWCLATKGCGALGADTVIVFFDGGRAADASAYFERKRWEISATEKSLSGGLEMQWSWE